MTLKDYMNIKLYNTLTRKKEDFKSIHSGKVGLYSCGPTVYQSASIGNFRAFVFSDLLRRMFEFNGYEVKHIMNITDVGHLTDDASDGQDKMEKSALENGMTAYEIAEKYTVKFLKDIERLNIEIPTKLPKATEHIEDQIKLIQDIEKAGFTYQTSDGIYFDTSKLSDYGKLGGQKLDEKEEGARVEKNPEKRNHTDFALWKFSPKDENRQMEWDSPWGIGFPGWHVECSAMSEAYLDVPFDVHTGGEDHIAIHHTNEIAQTQAARDVLQANYWMHNAFLMVDGGKMGKSLGNAYTLDDLEDHGFEPLVFRYFLLGAHYKKPQNFTWDALTASQNALNKLRNIIREWSDPGDIDRDIIDLFRSKINNDLDLAGALSVMWNMVYEEALESSIKSATLLKMDEVLGLKLKKYIAKSLEISKEVQILLKQRKEARANKDWDASDRLRDEILKRGFVIDDKSEGQVLREI